MNRNVPAPAAKLLNFIKPYEAGPAGYDTVYGNCQSIMAKPITSMRLIEVIADGPRRTRETARVLKRKGSSAAGLYQFMPPTLKAIIGRMQLTGNELMTGDLQDLMAFDLLKVRGYERFMAGKMSREAFGRAIAQEWASFPVLADCKGGSRAVKRGQSFYAGDGQNKAGVAPEKVEAVLDAMKAMGPVATTLSPVPFALPEAPATVQPAGRSGGFFGKLLAAFSRKPFVPEVEPTQGDPTVYRVQVQLKKLGYYEKLLDGKWGGRTRDAVSGARKDNGLGDGEIDDAFLAALPSFKQRPVSKERATASIGEASAARPEVFSAPKGMVTIGGISATVTGLSEIINRATGVADKTSETIDQVQSVLSPLLKVTVFIATHPTLILWGVLGVVLVWGVSSSLSLLIKFRQAFL